MIQEDEDRSEKGDIDNDNGEDLEVDVVAVDSVPHYVSRLEPTLATPISIGYSY